MLDNPSQCGHVDAVNVGLLAGLACFKQIPYADVATSTHESLACISTGIL